MRLIIENPSKAFISEATNEELDLIRKSLSYTNTAAQHQVKRHYNNVWARSKDPDLWEANLEILKKAVHNTLLFEDDKGYFIRPGSIPYLVSEGKVCLEVTNKVNYPKPKKVPWAHPLSFELYPYQEKSWQNLLEVKHGNVELCTGSGKSAILLKICRETGLRSAIITPSQSVFLELLEKFEYHFGKGMVGTFGNGKKKLGKQFTICISDSIANIKPGSKEWNFFSELDMIEVDESHTWGAETLETICHGILSNIPYRFFFSGTQIRNSGDTKLLHSIIGQTVYTLNTKEAVDGKFICPHSYRIITIESSNPNYMTADAIDMKRAHFLRNSNICAFIAKLANIEATIYRRQTLVLVEELSQIAELLPLLKVPTAIAHSEKKIERLQELSISKVNNKESVEKFNKSEALVLIGTSCIATGTNIFANHNTVNWVGGASPIKTLQGAVGRSVRLHRHNPWKDNCVTKDKCTIFDFDIYDIDIMSRHLKDRISCYEKSDSEIKYIRIKK